MRSVYSEKGVWVPPLLVQTPFPKDGRTFSLSCDLSFLFVFAFFFLLKRSVFFVVFLVFLSPSLCFISSRSCFFCFITPENPTFVRDFKRNSSLCFVVEIHTHTHSDSERVSRRVRERDKQRAQPLVLARCCC